MLVQLAQLAALLAVAAGPAGGSKVSMMREGTLTFCGKQACFAPNICLPFLGVNVCVRTNTPKCSDTKCPPKYECALLQDVCDSLPCHPKAYCVKHNPCGICLSPDHFCELLPTPVCRHVVEPTCLNKKCGFGEMCKKEPLKCSYPPCRVKFSCVTAWPYHYDSHISDRHGARKSAGPSAGIFNAFNGFTADVAKAFIAGRAGSAGGAGGAEGAGDAGGAGGAGGSSDHSSGSHGHFSGSGFGSTRPISHAAGAFNTLSSVGGGSAAAGGSKPKPKKAGPKTKEEAQHENQSVSDTDDEDEE